MTVVSESSKKRRLKDGSLRRTKEVIVHTDAGYKRKNGKQAIISKTMHLPID